MGCGVVKVPGCFPRMGIAMHWDGRGCFMCRRLTWGHGSIPPARLLGFRLGEGLAETSFAVIRAGETGYSKCHRHPLWQVKGAGAQDRCTFAVFSIRV